MAPSDYYTSLMFFISCVRAPNQIFPISRVQRMRHVWHGRKLETVELHRRSQSSSMVDQVRMKLPANTHSIAHHRCLPVRPDSGTGFITPAHYATPTHMG